MKHIFLIHSHITFFVAKQYIQDYHIAPCDCVLFCCRGYSLPQNYVGVFTSIIRYPQDVFAANKEELSPFVNVLTNFRGKKKLESAILSYCNNEPFLFYPFYTASHFVSLVVSMPQCQGYYIIEEGTSAYLSKQELRVLCPPPQKWYHHILRSIFPKFYGLIDEAFSENSLKYKGTLSFSNRAFSTMGGEHIVLSNPFEQSFLSYSPNIILSIDGSLSLYAIDMNIIEKVYTHIEQFIRQKDGIGKVIAYKFHPMFLAQEELQQEIRDIIHTIFREYTVKELDKTISIENLLNTYHCDFYTDLSSVGIYKDLLKCDCYSYAAHMAHLLPNSAYYKSYINSHRIINLFFYSI